MNEVTKRSFKKVQENLLEKGIENVHFLNPEKWIDVYPFDYENITDSYKFRIIKEAIDDFWYFSRELCFRVYNNLELKYEPFKLNIGTTAMLHSAINGLNVYSTLPMFSSTANSLAKYYLWKLWKKPNYIMKVIAPSESDAQIFVNKVWEQNNCLPIYMRLNEYDIRNRIRILKTPKNKQHAECIGRGMTTDVLIIDLEYIKYIDIILKSLVVVMSCTGCQVIAFSSVGEKGTYGKMAGDKIFARYNKWIDELYDVSLKRLKNTTMIINYDYEEIYKSIVDSEEEYEEHMNRINKLLNNDKDLLNKKVYMKR